MPNTEFIWNALNQKTPLCVGAIADHHALTETIEHCDLVELRLDSLGVAEKVQFFARNCPLPLLITARGPKEGGQGDWTPQLRQDAYMQFLPYASAIDIELADFGLMSGVIAEAKSQKIPVIGSFHDFIACPTKADLLTKADPLADLHKFAIKVNQLSDLTCLLEILSSDRPLSVMGMGPLGAAARPVMAKLGSILNYGYLGDLPTAPDQWPAGLLQKAIAL